MTVRLSPAQVRSLRMKAQYLSDESRQNNPEIILSGIVGAQAQELPSAYISIRARCNNLTINQLQQIHLEERKLCWTWSVRGTLHLITTSDACWMIPLLGPDLISRDRRRMSQLGWTETSAARGVELIGHMLDSQETASRGDIANLLAKNGLPYEGQATAHLIFRAAWEGLITHAGFNGSKPIYSRFDHRYGKLTPIPAEEGLVRLVRSYLFGFGPARLQDFINWSGITISKARPAWNILSNELDNINVEDITLQLLKDRSDWLENISQVKPAIRLLPRYDTYLLGYENRRFIVDPALEGRLYPGGGIISATIIQNGLVIGIWKLVPGKKLNRIEVTLFEAQSNEIKRDIEAEIDEISRFHNKPIDVQFALV